MSVVLASTLSDKPVMRSDGRELGTVRNVTMNVATGELVSVIVSPATDDVHRFDTTDDGNYIVPAGSLRSVDDYLVID